MQYKVVHSAIWAQKCTIRFNNNTLQATSTSTFSSRANSKMSSTLPSTLFCIIIVVQLQNDQPHNSMPVFTIQLGATSTMSSTTLQLHNTMSSTGPLLYNSTTIWAPQVKTQAAPQQYELHTVVSTRPSVVNSLAALVIIFTALATCVIVKVTAAVIVINI